MNSKLNDAKVVKIDTDVYLHIKFYDDCVIGQGVGKYSGIILSADPEGELIEKFKEAIPVHIEAAKRHDIDLDKKYNPRCPDCGTHLRHEPTMTSRPLSELHTSDNPKCVNHRCDKIDVFSCDNANCDNCNVFNREGELEHYFNTQEWMVYK